MLKSTKFTKGSMIKHLCLLVLFTLLSGCFGSVAALLGPASTTAASGASGNIARGAFTSTVSFGVKKQTGKLPIEHAVSYAEEKNSIKKKEPCLAFAQKTNVKICSIAKKQLNLTKSKIINGTKDESIKDLTSSLQPNIDINSKIKYLD